MENLPPPKDNDESSLPGLPEMDEQHRYLLKLFDRIEQSFTVTRQAALAALLPEIEGYLHFHFASEEHLMRHYRFPGFPPHQSDHEAAAARFVRFLDDFEANRLNPGALRIFLRGWLLDHGATADREYAAWIAACRENFFKSKS
jgi:hemerythrin